MKIKQEIDGSWAVVDSEDESIGIEWFATYQEAQDFVNGFDMSDNGKWWI